MERVDEIRGLRHDLYIEKFLLGRMFLRERYDRLCRTNKCIPIDELVEVIGGGTPSKKTSEYWQGNIPWVSPKDMKVAEIYDVKDHISDDAVKNSSTKVIDPPAVLFVVRGMILAHTLPVAVSRVQLAVNQDIKALKPKSERPSAEYLALMLRGASGYLLHNVEIAGHGTRRLKTSVWSKLPIPILPSDEERVLVEKLGAVEGTLVKIQEQDLRESEISAMQQSILRKAFAGEL